MKEYYGTLSSFGVKAIMSDDVISKTATCGKRIRDYTQLRRHVCWALGHDQLHDGPNEKGALLMDALASIYAPLDKKDGKDQEREKVEKRKQVEEAKARKRQKMGTEEMETGPQEYEFHILTQADGDQIMCK